MLDEMLRTMGGIASDKYNSVKSMGFGKAGFGLLKGAAVGAAPLAGIGLLASGGNPRGAWHGVWGGLSGGVSGAAVGMLGLGLAGAGAGALIASSPFARAAVSNFIRKHGPGLLSKGLGGAKSFQGYAISDIVGGTANFFSKSSMEGLAQGSMGGISVVSGAIGGFTGVVAGSIIGGARGAWHAGRNIKASEAYNSFGAIGL